jgi:hypothetical protein
MRIGAVEVFVADQDKVGVFYTGMFRSQVKNDASYGDTAHWLTVVSPEDPDGPVLLSTPTSEAAAGLQAARREMGAPAVSFTTQDCRVATERSLGGEAVLVSAPQPMGYGGTDAAVEDGRGNLLNLAQD